MAGRKQLVEEIAVQVCVERVRARQTLAQPARAGMPAFSLVFALKAASPIDLTVVVERLKSQRLMKRSARSNHYLNRG